MNGTSGRRSEAPRRAPASRAFMRAIERASRDSYVPPTLQGALRALSIVRRRSGRDPGEGQLDEDERELRALLPFVFRGDSIACARAHAIVRRLLTAML